MLVTGDYIFFKLLKYKNIALLLNPKWFNLGNRGKVIKLSLFFIAFLFQTVYVGGQSLSSILEFRNSYGFRVKRNQIEQYSNIALCKENENSLSFIGTKIIDSKSTALVTIDVVTGKTKHRRILLPDSIVKQIGDNNDAVQAIVLNSNFLTIALLQEIHVFKLDETNQKFQYIKSCKLPSLISEVQMVDSTLVIFGSYPKYMEEIRNNFVAAIDLTTGNTEIKFTWLSGYDASIYHILSGTKYLMIGEDKKAIITDPRKLNQYTVEITDTGIAINGEKS